MQSTAFEAEHPIALRGQSGIVRGHHGGQAVFAMHLAQQGMQGIGGRLVEIAGRSIGGLCSRTLRFRVDASLEELILRQACGLPIESLVREDNAGGVMMIPIPGPGILRSVRGVEAASAVPGIESVEITARLHNLLVPLPEGESYLGFIFARGATPDAVETSLRAAHACLQFGIEEEIPLWG